jgi:hypothetical protein
MAVLYVFIYMSAIGDYLTCFGAANSMVETYKAKAVSVCVCVCVRACVYGLALKQ